MGAGLAAYPHYNDDDLPAAWKATHEHLAAGRRVPVQDALDLAAACWGGAHCVDERARSPRLALAVLRVIRAAWAHRPAFMRAPCWVPGGDTWEAFADSFAEVP